ncbi:MAG: hypothetical protein ACRC5H_10670 [Treponemataceae bacterium]
MNKPILIFGQDFAENDVFITTAKDHDRTPFIAHELQENAASTHCITWNRTSPISARSVILAAENKFSTIDEVLIIFDANRYVEKIASSHVNDFTKAIDLYISSYTYICSELINRATKYKNMHVVFLLKQAPTPVNLIKNLPENQIIPIPLCMAQASFESLAENLQAQYSNIHMSLVKSEAENDEEIAHWLFDFIDKIKNKKTKGWIKVGTKMTGLLSLFR